MFSPAAVKNGGATTTFAGNLNLNPSVTNSGQTGCEFTPMLHWNSSKTIGYAVL
jgi:hypothetical protein